jgi:hypothetical protein
MAGADVMHGHGGLVHRPARVLQVSAESFGVGPGIAQLPGGVSERLERRFGEVPAAGAGRGRETASGTGAAVAGWLVRRSADRRSCGRVCARALRGTLEAAARPPPRS